MDYKETELFQKIRVKPKLKDRQPDWKRKRNKSRQHKRNMQEYFMNTHNRRSKDYA